VVEKQIGRPVVKVLNSIGSKSFGRGGTRHGSRDRVALPISGDNPKAKEQSLNSLIGSASILLMPELSLNRAATTWISRLLRQSDERGTSAGVKKRGRSFADYNKEMGTKAYRAVENADYQTQANAFRSLFNEK